MRCPAPLPMHGPVNVDEVFDRRLPVRQTGSHRTPHSGLPKPCPSPQAGRRADSCRIGQIAYAESDLAHPRRGPTGRARP
jgi:hypothetical protein